jgi:hypothetical protein
VELVRQVDDEVGRDPVVGHPLEQLVHCMHAPHTTASGARPYRPFARFISTEEGRATTTTRARVKQEVASRHTHTHTGRPAARATYRR